jgi:nucleotide-binding universal stress UspA family protein
VQTILVGYDGTRPSERAIGRAAELARAFDARVVVAWVAPPPFEPGFAEVAAFGLAPLTTYPSPTMEAAEDELWRQHRDRVTTLLSGSGVRFELARSLGNPAGELVELAEEVGADLLVVGTREASFVERLLSGSVSQSVARHADCDVLIVRAPHDD